MQSDDGTGSGTTTRFLHVLRESSRIAQEIVGVNRELSIKVQVLQGELAEARRRQASVEAELERLKAASVPGGTHADGLSEQLAQMIEEQNCLIHLYVASENLAAADSASAAIAVAMEVLHNMVGAEGAALWIGGAAGGQPVLVAKDAKSTGEHEFLPLVNECLRVGQSVYPPGASEDGLPVCVPLLLLDRAVGAMVIPRLVPQAPALERLQRDLLDLLSYRLARTVLIGDTLESDGPSLELWSKLQFSVIRSENAND